MRHALLVVALFMLGCGMRPYQIEMRRNNNNIAELDIGISSDSTYTIMGKPRLREAYTQKDGSTLEVWFYYTNTAWSDGNYTKDEMTPILLRDKRLIGWGQDYYTQNIKLVE